VADDQPDSVLVGRAVTATFVPGAAGDIHRVIDERGHNRDHRSGAQNTWAIDLLKPGDVYVVNQFGAHVDGPTIGDNLGNSISANSGNGIVYDGLLGYQWAEGDRPFTLLPVLSSVRSHPAEPQHHARGINTPIRIGKATAMPGDVVLGRDGGVIFIPPHWPSRSSVSRSCGCSDVRSPATWEKVYTPDNRHAPTPEIERIFAVAARPHQRAARSAGTDPEVPEHANVADRIAVGLMSLRNREPVLTARKPATNEPWRARA
jgi:regulator of RNase E activity RraA